MTTIKHYPSSAPGRLAEFFRENPTEELELADLYAKFGDKRNTLRMALYRLVEEGVLESVHIVRVKRGVAPRT